MQKSNYRRLLEAREAYKIATEQEHTLLDILDDLNYDLEESRENWLYYSTIHPNDPDRQTRRITRQIDLERKYLDGVRREKAAAKTTIDDLTSFDHWFEAAPDGNPQTWPK